MKKIIILLFLAPFLLCVNINAESPNNPNKESAKSRQIPKTEQHGSDKSPVVVKIIPPTINAEESAANKQERKEKQEADWWLVRLTGIIAIIGGLQLFVFGLQARRLRQAVKATEKAANALPIIERAYVFVNMKGEVKTLSGQESRPEKIEWVFYVPVNLINEGKTPAVLIKICAGIIITRDRPTIANTKNIIKEIPFIGMSGIDGERRVIRGGEGWHVSIRIAGISNSDYADVLNPDNRSDHPHLYCCGRVIYKDVMKDPQTTLFCWKYGGQNRFFSRADNDELNDYT